jgi:hypothetical protein
MLVEQFMGLDVPLICVISVQAGNPLSERKLAQMFGRTSRRWARARITEARQSP